MRSGSDGGGDDHTAYPIVFQEVHELALALLELGVLVVHVELQTAAVQGGLARGGARGKQAP